MSPHLPLRRYPPLSLRPDALPHLSFPLHALLEPAPPPNTFFVLLTLFTPPPPPGHSSELVAVRALQATRKQLCDYLLSDRILYKSIHRCVVHRFEFTLMCREGKIATVGNTHVAASLLRYETIDVIFLRCEGGRDSF